MSEFTHLNLVIRLSKMKQSAFLLSAISSRRLGVLLPVGCFNLTYVKPFWTARNLPFCCCSSFSHFNMSKTQQACPFPAGMVFLWGQTFVHLIRLNLKSRLMPIRGLTDYRPFEGITHDSLGLNWIPFRFVASTFSSTKSPFGPSISCILPSPGGLGPVRA